MRHFDAFPQALRPLPRPNNANSPRYNFKKTFLTFAFYSLFRELRKISKNLVSLWCFILNKIKQAWNTLSRKNAKIY